mgnify:FL=1
MTVSKTKPKTETANETRPETGDTEVFAMTHMLHYSAKAKDASFAVTELFFDPDEGVLRYVALDIGGWFDRREVIVSEGLMGVPDNANRTWPAEISPEAIKEAREWTDPKVIQRMSMPATPHIMIGPFGGHFAGASPLEDPEAGDVAETEGNLRVDGFERLNDWVGLPVIGQDGEVGTSIDFLFEADTRRLSHLVIDTGGLLAARQVVVPYDLLRGLGEKGQTADVNVTQALLQDAPPLEHFDEINRSWIDALRNYYQLAPRF